MTSGEKSLERYDGNESYSGVAALFNGDLHRVSPGWAPRDHWEVFSAQEIRHRRTEDILNDTLPAEVLARDRLGVGGVFLYGRDQPTLFVVLKSGEATLEAHALRHSGDGTKMLFPGEAGTFMYGKDRIKVVDIAYGYDEIQQLKAIGKQEFDRLNPPPSA